MRYDIERLQKYGFQKKDDQFELMVMLDERMALNLMIHDQQLTYQCIDQDTQEEYMLIHQMQIHGKYVDGLREKLQDILDQINLTCQIHQKAEILEWVKEKYEIIPSFPFGQEYDVLIEPKSNKMFAFFAKVKGSYFHQDVPFVETMTFKNTKQRVKVLLEQPKIYPGYHMHKATWITILLDETLKNDRIFSLLEESYDCVLNTKKLKEIFLKKF